MLSDLVKFDRREIVRDSASLAFILASNVLPLVGVLLFGWRVFDIVLLYWFENVIIGVFNVVKIATCMPGAGEPERAIILKKDVSSQMPQTPGGFHAIKLFLIPFFSFHYGIFCTVHGLFICSLLGEQSRGLGSPLAAVMEMMVHPWFSLAVAGLVISHGVSLVKNYYLRGEYKRSHPIVLLFTPYGRIVVLHVAILLSAFLTLALGSPIWMLVLLIIGKTVIDVTVHLAFHRLVSGDSGDSDDKANPLDT